ncbi:MAG: hypothetical protein ACP5NS_01540 [Candidatus Pacearchaeota archaeon]
MEFDLDDYQKDILKILILKSPRTVHELISETRLFLYIFKLRIRELIKLGLVEIKEEEIYQHSKVEVVKDKISLLKKYLSK